MNEGGEQRRKPLPPLCCTVLESSPNSIESDETVSPSLLRYLIVQQIFISFPQTSMRGVYFPTIHVGLDHVTCFG